MMPALVHIGYHKTATSWFQERFYPHVANAALVPRKLVRSAIIEPDAFSFSADHARRVILAFARGKRPLLCEENLSGYLHNGGLGGLLSREVADRLAAVFPDAQIVVLLRSQPSMVAAAYAQYVAAGGTYSLSRYAGLKAEKGIRKYWYKAPAFSLDQLRYQPLLDHYAQRFGKAAVRVYLFEEMAADSRAFAQRFAAAHALDVDLELLDYSAVNRSLSPRQLRILAQLNLFTDRSVPNKRWLANRTDWYARRWTWLRRIERLAGFCYSDAPLLSPEQGARVASTFAGSNQALQNSWLLPLEGAGYPVGNQT